MAGANVTFSVVAAGTSPLSYQWRFNGTSLAGATSTTLTLTNVQVSQSGSYALVVSNAFGIITSSNAVLTITSFPSCLPAPSGLVSWWRGEGDCLEAIGANNGTLQNGATFASGRVGQAFTFDGINDYVKVPRAASLDAPSQLTIDFWMKADPSQPIGSRVVGLVTSDFYGLEIGTAAAKLGVGFWISTDNGDHYAQTLDANSSGAVFPAGEWHHIAGVYDGAKVQLYLDGQALGNPVAVTGRISPMLANSFVAIGSSDGRTVCSSQCIGTRYFKGQLDEVDLFNRALSASEIQAIYTAGSAGKCPLGVRPSIVAQPVTQAVLAGSTATFTVTAAGPPPLSYQWRFNGTNVAGATGTSLMLSNVQCAQAGNYSVIVTNAHGSAIGGPAALTVVDRTPPVLNCPGAKVLEFQDERGAIATYSVTATDVCSAVTLVVAPLSGSLFPIGVTPVHVQATDGYSNSAQCSFTVTVLGAQGVNSNVLAQLIALRSSVILTDPFAQRLDDAIQHMANSLNPAYWIDQTHLQPKGGNTAMNEEKLAVSKLWEIMGPRKCPVDPAVLQGFIDRIVKSIRLLAVISIQDAAKAGLNARKIAEALAMVAKGDREAATRRYASAIDDYRNAWRHVLQLRLLVVRNPDGTTRLQFVGDNSKCYLIEASTDMVKWMPLGACTADDEGNVEFTDPTVTKQPLRFYRAVQQ